MMNTKKVLLKSITLKDWKAQNREVVFSSEKTSIRGRNGSGKSTIIKAWNWLFTGYSDPFTTKNSELFDNRKELSPDTPIASVKAVLEIDGVETTIERQARCTFVRRRGSNEYEKASSDTYKTFIDEIETTASAFGEWVERNFGTYSLVTYCLDGNYFCTLANEDKVNARNVLKDIAGEINDSDYKGDYSVVMDDIKKYTITGARDRAKKAISPLKDRIVVIDATIKDKERLIGELLTLDFNAIKADILEKKNEILKIDDLILGNGEAIKPILGERDKIFELISQKSIELNKKKTAYLNEFTDTYNSKLNAARQISAKNLATKREKEENESTIERYTKLIEKNLKSIERCEAERVRLLEKRDEIKSRAFTSINCPYCGTLLDEQKQEEAKKEFESKQREEIDRIVYLGRSNNEDKLSYEKEIQSWKSKIEELKAIEHPSIDDSEETLMNEANEFKMSFVPFEETETYKTYSSEINRLKESMPSLPQDDNKELTERKKVLMDEIDRLNWDYGKKLNIDKYKNDIELLNKEKSEIFLSIAYQEAKIDAIAAYIQERADIVSERINGRLKGCKIEMYSTQKDGSLVGNCVITDANGVKFSTLNNSARILIAIEIQKLFMSHFGVELPIFVDECSVFDSEHLPNNEGGQIVYLFASDTDLTIE